MVAPLIPIIVGAGVRYGIKRVAQGAASHGIKARLSSGVHTELHSVDAQTRKGVGEVKEKIKTKAHIRPSSSIATGPHSRSKPKKGSM